MLAALAVEALVLSPVVPALHARPEAAALGGALYVAGVLLLGRRAEGRAYAVREAVLAVSAGAAAAFTAAVIMGVGRRWDPGTLAALAIGATGESLVAIGLSARVAMLEERHAPLFLPGVALTVVVGIVQLLLLTLGAA